MTVGTVTLTIDDREITVPKGTLVIRAAEQLGIIIPRFCDHPLLDPLGACRQCIVDVEGQRKPMTACTTQATDGMVVRTQMTSDVAATAQRGQLEFLLINHPLDCPMCDKGGECPLQDQALLHGPGESRFVDQKRRYAKPVAVSAQVLLDRERCVLCARCTRFSNEIAGDPFIELFERGALEQVAIYEDEPYVSYFSGNVIQICPVGALTSAAYRFRARPFDLRSSPSVCGLCSAGCNLTVQSRRGDIQRQLARTNMAVNEMWNCDKGRFGFRLLDSDARLREPAIRKEGDLVAVSWSEALTAVADAVRRADETGPGRVAVLTGSRLADEDAYAASKYVRTVLGTDDVDFRTTPAGPDEDAALAAVLSRPTATYAEVEAAPATIVVGLDPEEEVPILHLRLRKAWRTHQSKIVPIGARSGSLTRYAWRVLPTAPSAELGAMAALARALGVANLADAAVSAGYKHPHLDDVAAAFREAGHDAVILVGERGARSPGILAAAVRLADHLGCKLAWVPRRAGARGALAAGLAPGFLPGGRRSDDEADRTAVSHVWGALPEAPGRGLQPILEAAAAGDIDVLHLIGIDLVRDSGDPDLVRRALDRVATVVVQDLATNATTPAADILLPVTATQERAGTFTNWEGRSQQFRAVIDGPSLCQGDWEVLVQLAAVQGRDLGFHDLDGLRAEQHRLGVRSGDPRPVPDPVSPAGDGAPAEGFVVLSYPTLLDRGTMLTGATDLLAAAPPATIGLNPEDAQRLDIEAGTLVTVSSGEESVTLAAVLEPGLMPGVVFVPANSAETSGRALASPAQVAPAEVPA
ncbi:MAG: NADH-quinone oxidoreductase subunit G [Actinobacteria bacterium]|nr:NADH-quinone oxidoreductase subunit G [Actinomycetota bacterium]